jgi:hypothetical protein
LGVTGNLRRHIFVVGMAGGNAAGDHFHPCFAVFDQSAFEGETEGIAASENILLALFLEIILERVPGEFEGVFKGLNETLPLKLI